MKVRVLAVLAIALALSLVLRVHTVRTDAGGELFWNSDNVYFFIGMVDRGYNFSYLGYVVEIIREIYPLGASGPEVSHCSMLVLHVTPNSIQQYTIDNFCSSGIEPLNGSFYDANELQPNGPLMRWSNGRFEPVTPEEQARLQLAMRSGRIPPGPSYNDVEGWSKRPVVGEIVTKPLNITVEEDSKVTVEIGGEQLTFVMNSGFISHHAYVDLIRPGQLPKRIWYLDGAPHRISGSEYNRIFAYQLVQKALSH